MNIYIVQEQDMERVEVFTSRKRAVRYLYSWGYHPKFETDMFEIWGRDYNQPERGFFRAYLEEKELVGAEHNYKYECKQLRATVRYLHRKIDKMQNQLATLGRGTCHNVAPSYLDFLCSECGFVHYHSDENDSGDGNEWRYCPSCGAEVVYERLTPHAATLERTDTANG